MNEIQVQRAYDKVRIARSNTRPTAAQYIDSLFTGFIELHGDRCFGDDPAITSGLAWLNDTCVTVIALEKGANVRERIRHNFGAANPEGYRKAIRLMVQAEKFGRPVICLVDTSGAYCGIEAEERGQGAAIAQSISAMLGLRVPTLSILIGEGGSGGALALAAASEVWMLENAVYSVISPEGCASILWKDSGRAADAAESLKLTALDALRLSVVDRMIPEDGLGRDEFFAGLREALYARISEMRLLPAPVLLERRYERFRTLGMLNIKSTHGGKS